MEKFDKVYKIKKEYNSNEFLRKTLIGLTKDRETPRNIMDLKILSISECVKEMLFCVCEVKVNYFGSIGYDRVVTFKEYDRFSNKVVEKRKTVTDWQPYSGNITVEKCDCCINDDEEYDNLYLPKLNNIFLYAISTANKNNFINSGRATVYGNSLENAISGCKHNACKDVEWPGDKRKDEKYNCSYKIIQLDCFIVPFFSLVFEYEGKKYNAGGFAFGEPNETHEHPNTENENESITMKKINNEKDNKISSLYKRDGFTKLFIVLAVLSGIVGIIALFCLKEDDLFTMALIIGISCISAMAVFIVCAVLNKTSIRSKRNLIEKEFNERKEKLKNEKIDKLISLLNKLGLPALSVEEKNEIFQ